MPASETKRGILESTSKRVRMIFSVMASPNRIDILRILNSKGLMTYSELKSMAGFRSKKESGKFAYHLRKLLKQSLVGLNKAERRYAITNLGKLVLNLTRQIEEKSMIESGKMYVRTSNQTIEEFNPHKIIQCLVREANMSLEQSTKVTEEVENKIYKSHVSYLTSNFIRDYVNNVLIEHGLEEQMNRLIRIGIPIYDLNKKLNNNGLLNNSINDVSIDIAKNVYSEYLKNRFPKDILDMHYNGEIHLDDLGNWGIYPDTIFIDLKNLLEKDLYLNNEFPYLPRFSKLDDIEVVLPLLISIFKMHVSKEIVIENITKLFDSMLPERISSTFAKALLYSSFSINYFDFPSVTIIFSLINGEDNDDILLNALNGYLMYIEKVPVSKFKILILFSRSLSTNALKLISKITRYGGNISLSRNLQSSKGIYRMNENSTLPVISLHSLSLNLPNLAYQSNKDETYFRTKLALLLKPSLNALVLKKDMIFDNLSKGLLPALSNPLAFPKSGYINMLVNLTGLKESIFDILGNNKENGLEIVQKVIKTANDVVTNFDKRNSEYFGISIINDSSSKRFAKLDAEKFGKLSYTFGSYSQGIIINKKDIEDQNSLGRHLLLLYDALTGGFSIKLDTTFLDLNDSINLLSKSMDLFPYFNILNREVICNICGSRILNKGTCTVCRSNNQLTLT